MTKKQLIYLWQYFLSGGGGIVASDLVMRPNFNDMANLSLTSPSNGSATFNGTSDYVKANTAASGTFGTACFWAYSPTAITGSSTNGPAFKAATESVERAIYFGGWTGVVAGEVFSLGEQSPSNWRVYTTSSISAGWHFYSVVWTGSAWLLYIDGSAQSTTTHGTPAAFNMGTFGIGVRMDDGSTPTSYFAGNLANVAVWNRALTSDEINSIQWKRYDLLTAGESTGLVAWYALDDITGTSVPDSTGTYNATAY
jgi:hypothetical protein